MNPEALALRDIYFMEVKLMKETKTCSICGMVHEKEGLTKFDGKLLCSNCLAMETIICSHCGRRIWNDENSGSEGIPLCCRCYDDYYTTCTHCDRIIHREDAYYENEESEDPYCRDCYETYCCTKSIHDYYYKPAPVFHGKGERFFGVELEVDDAGECDDSADAVLYIGNRTAQHIYCKHDGSLDEGFEIVTHPMTLDYHKAQMPWDPILHKLRAMGYLSHQANTCGLHIHVNRDSLGETHDDQEASIARILYFFEKHWEELLKFSRRTNRQLERWAARYGYKDKPKDILDHAKCGGNNGRYSCINLQNTDTVEFRIFRGTLKYNTIIATLQLVNRVCDVAFSLTDDEIKAMSWTTFVSGCTEPELVQYLKERRIYINEPVATEEEV